MVARAFDCASAPCNQASTAEIAAGHAFDEHFRIGVVIGVAMRYEDSICACWVYPKAAKVDDRTWAWVEMDFRSCFDIDPAGMPDLIDRGEPAAPGSKEGDPDHVMQPRDHQWHRFPGHNPCVNLESLIMLQ
jgi:hypothetical protein